MENEFKQVTIKKKRIKLNKPKVDVVCRDVNSIEYITAKKIYPDFSMKTFTWNKLIHIAIEAQIETSCSCRCCDRDIYADICTKIGLDKSITLCSGCFCCIH